MPITPWKEVFIQLGIVFFLFFILVALSFIYIQIKSEGQKCINDPPRYFIATLDQRYNTNTSCLCTFDTPNSPRVYLNRYNSSVVFNLQPYLNPVDVASFQAALH